MEAIPMKKLKSFGVIAVALIIISTILFTGCTYDASSKVTSATLNERGELVINYADGKSEVLGDNRPEDSASSTNDIALATSKGLRSSVSIICEFVDNTSAYYSAGSGVILKLDKEKGNAFIGGVAGAFYGTQYCEGVYSKCSIKYAEDSVLPMTSNFGVVFGAAGMEGSGEDIQFVLPADSVVRTSNSERLYNAENREFPSFMPETPVSDIEIDRKSVV